LAVFDVLGLVGGSAQQSWALPVGGRGYPVT